MFQKSTELKLNLSSKPENIHQVENFLNKARNQFQLDEQLYFNLQLVLTEAVNNCIIHGNGCDPRKKVFVALQKRQEQLFIKVTDEGKGFDPRKVPDPTCPTRITEPNGRGVFLMRQLADSMRYSDSGRCLEISFSLSKAGAALVK